METTELNLLKSLAKQYPTISSACTEIINLQSILNLPKGTEHFMTDIHGAYEQFDHILRNGSGSVKRKINEEFGNSMIEREKKSLATLIYYPKEKLDLIRQEEDNLEDWYKITLHRLVQITKRASSKYTRSKVRKALPKDFAYIIEELITEKAELLDKEAYYNEIIHTIIRLGRAPEFIIALSNLIQRLIVDHLHIIGDIFDRGPDPDIIMDTLCDYHSVDVQWGNHDIVWMGAAAGEAACICNVIRIASRYGNLSTLEEGYGINLVPLVSFALETYTGVNCDTFGIKYDAGYNVRDLEIDQKIHKAITILQFKLEGQIIKAHPEFQMEERMLLHRINYETGCVTVEGKDYPMCDLEFPTIDPADPYALTEEEEELICRLQKSFRMSEKLQRHVRFLFAKGGLYKVFNSNLLYHGCVPMDENGEFLTMRLGEKEYAGRKLFDMLEHYARRGYYAPEGSQERALGCTMMWYLWTGEKSPIFGKHKMATFERYFIKEEETHIERKNAYYRRLDDEETINRILREFDLSPESSHIINGHVPVEAKKGESPVHCGGKLFIIDGGFSKAYQGKTGIAGYTLVSNSYGLRLVAHEPFESKEDAIRSETDVVSDVVVVETQSARLRVADTDIGAEIQVRIGELEELLRAYRDGILVEAEA
ncbi:MAG: fructose-1,6-bisphosphatase [Lachnospiraceae bacterium]|nr:fructose-1,6-bisphosphatase [Lachnospiraceae bacterium]